MQMSTLLLYVTIAGEIKCGWTREGEGNWCCLVQHTSLTVNDTLCTSSIEPQQHRRHRSSSGSRTVPLGLHSIGKWSARFIATDFLLSIFTHQRARVQGISIIARHFSESEGKYVFRKLCDLFHALMGSCSHSLSQRSFKKTCCSWWLDFEKQTASLGEKNNKTLQICLPDF